MRPDRPAVVDPVPGVLKGNLMSYHIPSPSFRFIFMIAVVFLLLVAPPPASAQQCTQGTNDNNPSGPLDSYTWSNDFIALTRLGSHYMPSYGDGDSMTEPFWLNGG